MSKVAWSISLTELRLEQFQEYWQSINLQTRQAKKMYSRYRVLNGLILFVIVCSVVAGAIISPLGYWAVGFAMLMAFGIGAVALFILSKTVFQNNKITAKPKAPNSAIHSNERKEFDEAQERVSAILNNMVDGVITIDKHGTIEMFSPAAEVIFGYTLEEVVGKPVAMLMPGGDADRHESYMSRYQRNGQAKIIGVGREVVGKRKDGTEFPMQLAIGEIRRGSDPVYVGNVHDLTERNNRDAIILHSQKMQAIGQLTGGIAHDFNNLLASVIIDLELASEKLDANSEIGELIRDAISSAQRGAGLNKGLLAFSRKQQLSPHPINLDHQLKNVIEILRRTVGENIHLEVNTGSGLWLCQVDPDQVENAIINLAINARDAMPHGGNLTIDLHNTSLTDKYTAGKSEVEPGDYVVIALTDNGIGMSREVLDRAFEPFFTTKPIGRGTGLGLSSIYGFAKQSGGNLTIYSEEGVGTTIKLYIPRSTNNVDADVPVVGESEPQGSGECILLVEDDEFLRRAAKRSIISLGYEVHEAMSGVEAMELVSQNIKFDILLTDIVLGGEMDGPTLAKQLLDANPDLSVLFMSGYTDSSVVHQGKLKADAKLLNKPFTKLELAQSLRNALTN